MLFNAKHTTQKIKLLALTLILMITSGLAQAQTPQAQNRVASQGSPVQPAGTNQAVTGSGTPGQLPKWIGNNGSSFVLGDSVISEDKFGKVGIGTTAPTSRLTVQGMIETTLGGLKFPDGTVQMTAATSGMQSIFHDTTLIGSGTQASPLGVAVPLVLTATSSTSSNFILKVTNTDTQSGGDALQATGGNTDGLTSKAGAGVIGNGGTSTGDQGSDTAGGTGVRAVGGDSLGHSVLSEGGIGVQAQGGAGVLIAGIGITTFGGKATGDGTSVVRAGDGILAVGGSTNIANSLGGIGLRAEGGSGGPGGVTGDAGFFDGAVEVNGSFSVIGGGTKNFKIDHPLDPENKYLYHAAIESSEVLNIYTGNITTDANGEATVTLPDWFEAINRDFRYQLTVVGTFAQAIVTQKIKGNNFTIKTNAPNVEVSWLVTSLRSDAAMLKHPFKAEQDKPKSERGSYLTPDAYDKPESQGVQWARNPQLMKQLKEKREAIRQQQSQPASDN